MGALEAHDTQYIDELLSNFLHGRLKLDTDYIVSVIRKLRRESPETSAILDDRLFNFLNACAGETHLDDHTAFVDRAISLIRMSFNSSQAERVYRATQSLLADAPECGDLLLLGAEAALATTRLDEAHTLLRKAAALCGAPPSAHFRLADVLDFLEDDAGALAAIEKARARITDDELFLNDARFLTIAASPLLRQGRLVEGWQARNNRRDAFAFRRRLGHKSWDGERSDTDILVIGEGGIGDEIKDASCYADLLTLFSRVIVSCDPRIHSLFQRSFPEIEFVQANRNEPVSRWREQALTANTFRINRAIDLDLYCLMTCFRQVVMAADLPVHFRRAWDDFPARQAFLVPDPERRRRWRRRLDALGPGLKVGLAWRSASRNPEREHHYFTLDQLLPLLSVDGVQFVNLQYDDCEAELTQLESDHGIILHRWNDTDLRDDLEDVAALMKELDMVISPYIMVKELSGAVGTRTLLLAPSTRSSVRWRMSPETHRDAWHPEVIHVPGSHFGDKEGVVASAAALLENAVREPACGQPIPPTEAACPPAPSGVDSSAEGASSRDLENACGETFTPEDAIADVGMRDAEQKRRRDAFHTSCNDLFANAVQPSAPDGVVLVVGESDRHFALVALCAHALLKRGWASVCLDQGPFDFGVPNNEQVAFFRAFLRRETDDNGACHVLGRFLGRCSRKYVRPRLRWIVDWNNGLCQAEGIDFHDAVVERLRQEFGERQIDFREAKIKRAARQFIGTAKAALEVCLEAERRLGNQGTPVRILCEPEHPAASIFARYCASRGRDFGIEAIDLRPARARFFDLETPELVSAVSCQNLTRSHLYTAAQLNGAQFETWLAQRRTNSPPLIEGRDWIESNLRKPAAATVQGRVVLDRIGAGRQCGANIACLFCPLPLGAGVSSLDPGSAHKDIRDWFDHTVSTLSNTDTLLLIKPHPREAKRRGREFFAGLIDKDPPDNVIILGANWLDDAEIVRHIGYGIVWRGKIEAALAAIGVPVLVCCSSSPTSQILDLPRPESKDDYEALLRHPDRIALTPELRSRAALIPEFYETEAIIPYPFGWIPYSGPKAAAPVLSAAAIRDYLAHGHASIDELCDRIV